MKRVRGKVISGEKNKGIVEEIFSSGGIGKKKFGEWVLRVAGGSEGLRIFLGKQEGNEISIGQENRQQLGRIFGFFWRSS